MPAKVYHYNLYGKRQAKYDFLKTNSVSSVNWTELNPDPKYHFFVPKDFALQEEYEKGVKVSELFGVSSMGIATGKDSELVSISQTKIIDKYEKSHRYNYRPFDNRFTVFDNKILQRARLKVMSHCIHSNLILNTTSANRQLSLGYVLISNTITDRHLLDSAADAMYCFPLYLYPENPQPSADPLGKTPNIKDVDPLEGVLGEQKPKPNFNPEIVKQIEDSLGMKLDWEAGVGTSSLALLQRRENSHDDLSLLREMPEGQRDVFTPTDLLDYIYAVLHSPSYREKYKEFLKIDFPRVPFGSNVKSEHSDFVEGGLSFQFWQMVKLGSKLRKLHLMERLNDLEISSSLGYPEAGDNLVEKPVFKDGKVYINQTQYFDNVPEEAWGFYIGGYQPAQKWLKDRKGRNLSFNYIMHYQKIIYVLAQTQKLMQQVDEVFKI